MTLIVNHLEKKIDEKQVLADISFELNPGEILGIVGRNGVGKTTLFRTMMNHYLPDNGSVAIDGEAITDSRDKFAQIFYLDQSTNPIYQSTPIKIGKYYQILYPNFDMNKYNQLLEKYQLPTKRSYRQFSKGMQGLFNIILGICSNAEFLILDEPFDGLDIIVKKQVLRLLLNEVGLSNRGILVSSHNLVELETLLDRALILKDGEIVNEYNLEEVRVSMKKMQMVFSNKNIPNIIKENATILSVRGRVVIGLFKELTPELEEQIHDLQPVLFEELPITLEDLFSSNLTNESDFQLFE